MAVGDGITWDEAAPTDATLATKIDDYNRDVRKGARLRLANEHEWPSSQTGTDEAGQHKFVTFQQQGSTPTMGATQKGIIYLDTDGALIFSSSGGSSFPIADATSISSNVVSITNTMISAVTTSTAAIPADNSVPQTGEGVQIASLAITPRNATNNLMIEGQLLMEVDGEVPGVVALFRHTTANAISAAIMGQLNIASGGSTVPIKFFGSAITTAAQTYYIRVGPASGTTDVTVNGTKGAGVFGGIGLSSLTITEYKT